MAATFNIHPNRIFGVNKTVTDTYQVLNTDATIVCNKATAFTVTLPATDATIIGRCAFVIKNIGVGVVTLVGSPGTDTIDGEVSQTCSQWESITLQCSADHTWIIT
jgi:hypothetical protein